MCFISKRKKEEIEKDEIKIKREREEENQAHLKKSSFAKFDDLQNVKDATRKPFGCPERLLLM